jgi:hypothetical protein
MKCISRGVSEAVARNERQHSCVDLQHLRGNFYTKASPFKDLCKRSIDLAAEKVFAAQKAGRKIAVEVKSFLNNSAITDPEKEVVIAWRD